MDNIQSGSLPGAAAAGSSTTPHGQYILVITKNAKCDICNQRNRSTMQKCGTCGLTTCATCHAQGRYEPRHNLAGMNLSWSPPTVDSQNGGGAARRGGNRGRGRAQDRPGSVRQSLTAAPPAAPSAASDRGRGRGRGRARGRSGLARQSINAGPPAPAAAPPVAGPSSAGTPPVTAHPAATLPAAAPLSVAAAPTAPPQMEPTASRTPLPRPPAGFKDSRQQPTFAATAAAAAAPAPSRATEADKDKGKTKEDTAMTDAPAPVVTAPDSPQPRVYDDAEILQQALIQWRQGVDVARVRREQSPLRALDMIEASATLTAMANGVVSMPLFHEWLRRMRAYYGIG